MPARIALLFEYPTLNGGERSMLQALRWVDRGEFELVALAPGTGRLADALRAASVAHVPFALCGAGGQRVSREAACLALAEAVSRVQPDLVHANSLSMGRITGSASGQLGLPCVAHLRDILGLSRAAIDDLNRNHGLVAVSAATREFHLAQGLDAARTVVVCNGVDAETFAPRPADSLPLRRTLGIPADDFVLLTVGQIGLRKGQDVLAAAAPAIVQQVPQAHFLIVGQRHSSKAESRAFETNVKAAFQQAGLGPRLHLLGYRDDVPQLMNAADLLVHPAKQEPLGRVLLEAAASALPIVATRVGGTAEIVSDGISARLIDPQDSQQLAAAVVELAGDRRLRRQLAAAARQRVMTEFTPAASADDLVRVWRRVLADECERRG